LIGDQARSLHEVPNKIRLHNPALDRYASEQFKGMADTLVYISRVMSLQVGGDLLLASRDQDRGYVNKAMRKAEIAVDMMNIVGRYYRRSFEHWPDFSLRRSWHSKVLQLARVLRQYEKELYSVYRNWGR